jgi:hypothetical protein
LPDYFSTGRADKIINPGYFDICRLLAPFAKLIQQDYIDLWGINYFLIIIIPESAPGENIMGILVKK